MDKLIKFFVWTGLTTLGLLINSFSLPLFLDSLHLYFGFFVFFLIFELLGPLWALAGGVLLLVQIYYLTQNPYVVAIRTLEFLVVPLIARKLRTDFIVSDWIFWTFGGSVLYLLAVVQLAKLEAFLGTAVVLKDAVNGIINASIATLLIIVIRSLRKGGEPVKLREVLFIALVGVSLIPFLFKSVMEVKEEEGNMILEARRDLRVIPETVKDAITYWLEIHLNAVSELAGRLVMWGPENRELLQRETQIINRAFKDFHACYIADENATAITFYPEVNPQGRYMIGTNFFYRPYYLKLKETLKPVFTDVFVAKFALIPVVGIAVPAVKDGEFIGYAYCGLRLSHIEKIVREFSFREHVFVSVLDSKGRVIASTLEGVKPFDKIKIGKTVTVHGDLTLALKEDMRSPFMASKFLGAYFVKEISLKEEVGWSILTHISMKRYVSILLPKLNTDFISVFFFTLVSFLIAGVVSSVITMPISRLAHIMSLVSQNLDTLAKPSFPSSKVEEVNLLSRAFDDLTSKLHEYMETLRRMAYYDVLTDLPNRSLLRDRLQSAIKIAKRNRMKVAVLFIDLDYFKAINDTMGHEVGDMLLTQVAKRMRAVIRESDTLARFGGDEFVAVAIVKDSREAILLAERILKVFDTPFEVQGREIYITASVGIALYPDNGQDPSTLIKNADIAMYRAKEQGKNSFAFFSEDLNKKAEELLTLKGKLHRALQKGEFFLEFQPIYKIDTKEVVGFEALLRWKDPERGVVPPSEFIPVLEETGLIIEVGTWVLEETFKQCKEWAQKYKLHLGVNVSPRQFVERNFVDKVLKAVEKTGVNPRFIVLEITETSIMQDPERTVQILKTLRDKGFWIAVDDFGTGYSSLSYLKTLPVDILKVDMVFTKGMTQNEVDRTIVETIIKLGKSLSLITLAEGVENEDQLKMLEDMGCDLAQGFYFSRPLRKEEVLKMLG